MRMGTIDNRLICNTLHKHNGTLEFKQVAKNLTVKDVLMMVDFHKLLLETINDLKYYNNELVGYNISLTRVNHMSWRIDINKDNEYVDSIEYTCTTKEPGISKATKEIFKDILEENM